MKFLRTFFPIWGCLGKLESQETSRERHPSIALCREQSIPTWNASLWSVCCVLLPTHIDAWASMLVRLSGEREEPFLQESAFTSLEGPRVESWHQCLPLPGAGRAPGQRSGGSARAPPVAAPSCLCWHSPTRRWSSPSRPGPGGRHWPATVHMGRWAPDLRRKSQTGPLRNGHHSATMKWIVLMVKPLLGHQRGVFPGKLFSELNGEQASRFF